MSFCSYIDPSQLAGSIVLKELGSGAYGVVQLIQFKDGQKFAVKKMDLRNLHYDIGITQSSLLDIDSLLRLQKSPDVIHVEGVCHDRKQHISLIMEPANSNLRTFILNKSVEERLKLLPTLMVAMVRTAALSESLSIAHFDIKPQNVLVITTPTETRFKVTDFGLARITIGHEFVPTNVLYTLWYRPPEYLGTTSRETFNIFAGDIWAIGVTLLEYIIKDSPFAGNNPTEVMSEIRFGSTQKAMKLAQFYPAVNNGTVTGETEVNRLIQDKLTPAQHAMINSNLIIILSKMLSLNPKNRPTGIEILQAFGQDINPSFLATLYSPNYPRCIQRRSIEVVNKVAVELKISKAGHLVTLELLGRLCEFISKSSEPLDLIILSVLRTSVNYTEESESYSDEIIDAYNKVIANPNKNIMIWDLAKIEPQILQEIQYRVYNSCLDPVIQRAYDQQVDISGVPPESFSESLDRWIL